MNGTGYKRKKPLMPVEEQLGNIFELLDDSGGGKLAKYAAIRAGRRPIHKLFNKDKDHSAKSPRKPFEIEIVRKNTDTENVKAIDSHIGPKQGNAHIPESISRIPIRNVQSIRPYPSVNLGRRVLIDEFERDIGAIGLPQASSTPNIIYPGPSKCRNNENAEKIVPTSPAKGVHIEIHVNRAEDVQRMEIPSGEVGIIESVANTIPQIISKSPMAILSPNNLNKILSPLRSPLNRVCPSLCSNRRLTYTTDKNVPKNGDTYCNIEVPDRAPFRKSPNNISNINSKENVVRINSPRRNLTRTFSQMPSSPVEQAIVHNLLPSPSVNHTVNLNVAIDKNGSKNSHPTQINSNTELTTVHPSLLKNLNNPSDDVSEQISRNIRNSSRPDSRQVSIVSSDQQSQPNNISNRKSNDVSILAHTIISRKDVSKLPDAAFLPSRNGSDRHERIITITSDSSCDDSPYHQVVPSFVPNRTGVPTVNVNFGEDRIIDNSPLTAKKQREKLAKSIQNISQSQLSKRETLSKPIKRHRRKKKAPSSAAADLMEIEESFKSTGRLSQQSSRRPLFSKGHSDHENSLDEDFVSSGNKSKHHFKVPLPPPPKKKGQLIKRIPTDREQRKSRRLNSDSSNDERNDGTRLTNAQVNNASSDEGIFMERTDSLTDIRANIVTNKATSPDKSLPSDRSDISVIVVTKPKSPDKSLSRNTQRSIDSDVSSVPIVSQTRRKYNSKISKDFKIMRFWDSPPKTLPTGTNPDGLRRSARVRKAPIAYYMLNGESISLEMYQETNLKTKKNEIMPPVSSRQKSRSKKQTRKKYPQTIIEEPVVGEEVNQQVNSITRSNISKHNGELESVRQEANVNVEEVRANEEVTSTSGYSPRTIENRPNINLSYAISTHTDTDERLDEVVQIANSRPMSRINHKSTQTITNDMESIAVQHSNGSSELNNNPFGWILNIFKPLDEQKSKMRSSSSEDINFETGIAHFITRNGVEYASYIDARRGFIKFKRHTTKPCSRTKDNLKLLVLCGSIHLISDTFTQICVEGNTVDLKKGVRYELQNRSNETVYVEFQKF